MACDGRSKITKVKGDAFAMVIHKFLASPKFQDLAQSTQVGYRHLLSLAERPDVLGAVPVDQMRPALVQAFLDCLSDKPATQKCAQTAIKSLEKWALVRDLLPHAISTGTEAQGGDGGHIPWTDDQVALAEQHARPHLARMITLAANTGQRGSDLVKMRWTDIEDYDGRPGINVDQVKTGLKIWVPLTVPLIAALATWERRPGFILLKEDNRPFTRPQLSDRWLRERDTNAALAPIREAGLVMHGLRGAAVVRLRRAGVPGPLICDMIGMSPPMVARYSRFSVQRDNAVAGADILDRTVIERARERKMRRNGDEA